jgi:hypothetical protein
MRLPGMRTPGTSRKSHALRVDEVREVRSDDDAGVKVKSEKKKVKKRG